MNQIHDPVSATSEQGACVISKLAPRDSSYSRGVRVAVRELANFGTVRCYCSKYSQGNNARKVEQSLYILASLKVEPA